MTEIDTKVTDKRLAERLIRLGTMDEKTWEKQLKSLPDVAEKGERVEAEAEQYILDEDLNEGAE